MMTLDEAAKLIVVDSANLMSRYKTVVEELLRNPDILTLLLVLSDDPSKSNALVKAIQFGLMMGIEMEKIPQQ